MDQIRKRWLNLMFINLGVTFLIPLIFSVVAGIEKANPHSYYLFSFITLFCFYLPLPLLMIYIFYRCAYKKPGLALLTFSLVCYFLMLPFLLIRFFQSNLEILALIKLATEVPHSLLFVGAFYFILFLNILSLLTGAFWVYYGLKLMNVNKDIQTLDILQVTEYKLATETMKNALYLEHLTQAYSDSVRNHPQIAWYFKRLYKELGVKFNRTNPSIHPTTINDKKVNG